MWYNFNYFPYQNRNTTIRVQQYLMNKYPDADFSDPDVMLACAKETVFGKELERINPEYRDAFVLGFMDRYFMNEIGQETWNLFRYQLAGMVRTNADIINKLFGLADTELFTETTVRKRDQNVKSQQNIVSNKLADEATKGTVGEEEHSNTNDVMASNRQTNTEGTNKGTSVENASEAAREDVNNIDNKNVNEIVDSTEASKEQTDEHGSTSKVNAGTQKTESAGSKTASGTEQSKEQSAEMSADNESTSNVGVQITDESEQKISNMSDVKRDITSERESNVASKVNSGLQTTEGNTSKVGNTSDSEKGSYEISSTGTIDKKNTGTQSTERVNNSDKETNATTGKKDVDKFSDTPQNGLEPVESGKYLTTARIIDSETEDKSQEQIVGSEFGSRVDDLDENTKSENKASTSKTHAKTGLSTEEMDAKSETRDESAEATNAEKEKSVKSDAESNQSGVEDKSGNIRKSDEATGSKTIVGEKNVDSDKNVNRAETEQTDGVETRTDDLQENGESSNNSVSESEKNAIDVKSAAENAEFNGKKVTSGTSNKSTSDDFGTTESRKETDNESREGNTNRQKDVKSNGSKNTRENASQDVVGTDDTAEFEKVYKLDYDKIVDMTSWMNRILDIFLPCFLLFY